MASPTGFGSKFADGGEFCGDLIFFQRRVKKEGEESCIVNI